MGIQINGNTNNINAGIGSLSIEDLNELDIVGVATASNFKTGVSNLHNVGLTLSGGQIDVGSNIKIGSAGIITATSFSGSGANLTGISQVGGSTGVDFNDNVKIRLGTGNDLQIYHQSSDNNSYIVEGGTGSLMLQGDIINLGNVGTSEYYVRCFENGAVQLRYDNSTKLATTSTGITISGNANFANNNKAIFGTGNDAAIYHNDTDFHIDAQESGATRNIYMTCGTVNEGGFFVRSDAGDTMFKALTDSSCFLYFDNSLKFRTMTDHCEIRGHLLPDVNNQDNLGSSSKRFANVYTNDLNLSNKGSTNSVDNTWGDYTIQEGESDLFLINNRSGKKYKFNLTEVV